MDRDAQLNHLQPVALEAVRYDVHSGLVPVVVQDVNTRQVLTLAYANREALKRTLGTGDAWFWSRSRHEYWRKGATSGNVQRVVDVRMDCDGDTVLYLVEPAGPACHTGAVTCFYRTIQTGASNPSVEAPELVEAANVPASADIDLLIEEAASPVLSGGDAAVLERLWQVIEQRWHTRPQGSYTTYLFEHGIDKVAKKVGEEGVEVVLAAKNATASTGDAADRGRQELAAESADLLFHLLALWRTAGLSPAAVYDVLAQRAEDVSGK